MPPTAVSCSGSSEACVSAGLDSLLMVNVNSSFCYHALHSLLKAYGTVLCIRLVYDKDFPSNRCYVTFLSCDEARLAFEHIASLPLAGCGFKTELLHSCNISDSDMDYIPNVFDNYLENSVPEVCQIPPSRWFVVYYRNGRGNFIHASQYLAKEIGMIPEGNLKKYSKGVLVTKMRNSSNMVLLTFFGSTLPDHVHIDPINLRVRRFVSCPLQCFSCCGCGHGKISCKEASRCGNCSALYGISRGQFFFNWRGVLQCPLLCLRIADCFVPVSLFFSGSR
ncbi:hypothetical protein E2C01_061438 [Portunus trituberculatus]|uniref:RRM domain-containing protein n=1 Tax=Portunus trituberculatus TaxID=210409 RepID=A0A5B7HCE6_PORTR|nr:hypothetical protein [Portunus trituberculatus]